MKKWLFWTAAAGILLGLAGCGGQAAAASLEVNEAWARAAPAGENSALFAQLSGGAADDQLLRVECEAAAAVEIHESVMNGDVMEMHPLPDGLELPAGETVTLQPGGLHVMLIGLKQELAAGETLAATFVFEQAGEVSVSAEVRAP